MLTLPIKACWFELIAAGWKTEEYRADTDYYRARFATDKLDADGCLQLELRNGYGRAAPYIQCTVRPRLGYGARRDWGGDPKTRCWILEIIHIQAIRRKGKI